MKSILSLCSLIAVLCSMIGCTPSPRSSSEVHATIEDIRVVVSPESSDGSRPVTGAVLGSLVAGHTGAVIGSALGKNNTPSVTLSVDTCQVVVRTDDGHKLRHIYNFGIAERVTTYKIGDRISMQKCVFKESGTKYRWPQMDFHNEYAEEIPL